MAIESRIESDLSGTSVVSQSRIEQILNGESITPRSRIEQLLQEYNPEDPGDYHKVECTKAQYDNMLTHSSTTIYVVTYPDDSVHFYLGDDEIAGEPAVLISKSITANGTYNASSDNADGYSSVTVNCDSLPVTFVKSIKSLGNSFVATDIVPTIDWTTVVDVTLSNIISSAVDSFLFGCTNTDSQNVQKGMYGVEMSTSNNGTLWCYFGINWQASNIPVLNAASGNITRNTLYAQRGRYIFGTSYSTNNPTPTIPTIVSPIGFFGYYSSRSGPKPQKQREITLYGVKLYNENGALVHNLVPAKHKTTNRGGLYDIITGTFYPSSSDFDDVVVEV